MENPAENLSIEAYKRLMDGEVPVLVDFYATWCEPCVILDEILTEIEARSQERLRIIKIDIDQQPELAAHFGFRSVPWLLLYNKGMEVWRMHGFMMTPDLERVIHEHTV